MGEFEKVLERETARVAELAKQRWAEQPPPPSRAPSPLWLKLGLGVSIGLVAWMLSGQLPEQPVPGFTMPIAPLIVGVAAVHVLFGRAVAVGAAAIIALISIAVCFPELGAPRVDLWMFDRILATLVTMPFSSFPDAEERPKEIWRGLCAVGETISARVRELSATAPIRRLRSHYPVKSQEISSRWYSKYFSAAGLAAGLAVSIIMYRIWGVRPPGYWHGWFVTWVGLAKIARVTESRRLARSAYAVFVVISSYFIVVPAEGSLIAAFRFFCWLLPQFYCLGMCVAITPTLLARLWRPRPNQEFRLFQPPSK